MLDPWIIEEIKKKEEERRREQERPQPTVEQDDREPPPDDSRTPGHEMPVERKPGHEMPGPGEPDRRKTEKKDEEPRRGVDVSRITGGDDDEDGDAIVIDIAKLPALPADDPKKDEKPG